ncbi:MAG: AAA family ATPase [bacterium]|jgi:ATP-dependent Clp protease ATP-binding subunit ClpA|nr:AAA family ATPase [candidate division KSB1 bacterium]MDH7560459.1 AAA family ATPase [bacterium]
MGRDLVVLEREGHLPRVIGRKKEMTGLARHLQRATKRNVPVIGEAEVGKTAIVEGLPQKIAAGEVPGFLQSLRVIQMNVSDSVAGIQYRGDMAQRLKRVIEEATAIPNVVLLLDEIHLAAGAGTGASAPMDVAALLKPALSRGGFQCMRETTVDEFGHYINSDAALLRRFQIIRRQEPSKEEAIHICSAWAHGIEGIQEVVSAEDIVPAAVELSVTFIRGRALPEQAIDLLENAAVLVKVSSLSNHGAGPTKRPPTVSRAHIVAVIEEQNGVSVRRSEPFDSNRIESALPMEVVGQDEAIEMLSREIDMVSKKAEVGNGPLAVFLFSGPTGTGKTFAAPLQNLCRICVR